MKLRLIRGIDHADEVLARTDPLDFSGLPATVLAQTHRVFGDGVTPEQSVSLILEDVRCQGDDAVRRYAKLLDDADLGDLKVSS
ncbi:MAG: hypothetical protein J4N33_06195, partial [Chloroflexi bacterium]|nr:hypothetical protein [Chloroflexota bacterium]